MGAIYLGEWRTVLWYQGMSRVVPERHQAGKGAQIAILSIAKCVNTPSGRHIIMHIT
jgi:hypothetical protein